MEIYKNLNTPQSKEFEQLLNNQLSKIQIEEGKIIEGKINKITEKYVLLYIENLKSENLDYQGFPIWRILLLQHFTEFLYLKKSLMVSLMRRNYLKE